MDFFSNLPLGNHATTMQEREFGQVHVFEKLQALIKHAFVKPKQKHYTQIIRRAVLALVSVVSAYDSTLKVTYYLENNTLLYVLQ